MNILKLIKDIININTDIRSILNESKICVVSIVSILSFVTVLLNNTLTPNQIENAEHKDMYIVITIIII